MTPQNTLKRSAYAAIGMPIDIATRLRQRVSSTRDTLGGARDRLSDQARTRAEEWADEGERLIENMSERSPTWRHATQSSFGRRSYRSTPTPGWPTPSHRRQPSAAG